MVKVFRDCYRVLQDDDTLWLNVGDSYLGSWPFIDQRVQQVLAIIDEPWCLGTNKDGNPKHPLYLKANIKPVKYEV